MKNLRLEGWRFKAWLQLVEHPQTLHWEWMTAQTLHWDHYPVANLPIRG